MKRKTKRTGSGGRLRLGLLLASAAAFLLVPAVQASAAPKLTLNIIAQPGASGEVTSESPGAGTPPIKCNYPAGGPQEGVCENEMERFENPFTKAVKWSVALWAEAGPGSKIDKWEVIGGEVIAFCLKGKPCTVQTSNESENIEVNLYLKNEITEMRLNLIGLEGGGGEVVSPAETYPFTGTPAIECNLPEGGTQEGVCENEMEDLGGEFGVGLEAFSGPNTENNPSWELVSGSGGGLVCNSEPTSKECLVFSFGEDVELNVFFACEEGEECPGAPPVEGPPLTVKFEEGEGTVVSNPAGIECTEAAPSEACTTEEIEAGSVTLTASPVANNLFKSWKGCTSVEGRKCTVSLTEAKTIGVKFSPAHAVTIEKSNNGLGSTSGVTCAYTCTEATASFADTKVVKLKAKAYKTADFTGWSGEVPPACEIGAPLECLLPAEAGDKTVQAEFTEKAKETLTVNKTGKGQGAVKSKPAGINCSYTCSSNAAYFYNGTSVELTASVQEGKGSTLGNWSGGGCAGTAAIPCVVSMTAAKSVTAEFE